LCGMGLSYINFKEIALDEHSTNKRVEITHFNLKI